MNKTKKWWMPVLLACLLMATLVGMAGARPNARPHDASPGWKVLTVPVQSCIPQEDGMNYGLWGGYLQCLGSSCVFMCPVNLATEARVIVQRLTLYVYDNDPDPDNNAGATLCKINPANKNMVEVARADTRYDEPDDPQVVMAPYIRSPLIRPGHGTFLTVHIRSQHIRVYGVRIYYTR